MTARELGRVADHVDAPVELVKAARPEPVMNRVGTDSERHQLTVLDNSVLGSCQIRHQPITWAPLTACIAVK